MWDCIVDEITGRDEGSKHITNLDNLVKHKPKRDKIVRLLLKTNPKDKWHHIPYTHFNEITKIIHTILSLNPTLFKLDRDHC